MNPFDDLRPLLGTIKDNADILPATGQAQEYLQRFDLDEYYDRIRTEDDTRVSDIREVPNNRLYVPLDPIFRTDDHVYRYFIDGSVRTFFLGTLVEHDRNSPVMIAQIGAAAVNRSDTGGIHVPVEYNRRELLLMINKDGVSEALWRQIQSQADDLADSDLKIRLVDTAEDDPQSSSKSFGPNREPRSRAAHRANWEMRVLERDLLRDILRNEVNGTDKWVIVDGGLGKEFTATDFDSGCIGVIKNFSKDQVFILESRGRTSTITLFHLLAKLDASSRTMVFGRADGRVAFWYVRLREQTQLEYPLMGVVKVEMRVRENVKLDSALVDRVSAALIAERSVTPHGKDLRWHAHLYPIFLAEQAIKTGFFSDEVLRAGVKWPALEQ